MVSVIVPAYNCSKYLTRCINSVLQQTYNELECIIVDDGSTDNETAKLCDKLKSKDARIKVMHKKNEGAERAREDGLKFACGQYIMFVDADDYIEKNVLEECVRKLENTNADIVCFDYCLNEHGKIGFGITCSEIVYSERAIGNMLVMKLLDGNMWCKLYRRELFYNVKFDTRRNCDFMTIYNILKNSDKIALIPLVGYHYSLIEGSQSRNNICHPREEEFWEASRELYYLLKNNINLKVEAEYYWLYTLLYVCIKMEKDRELSRNSDRFKRIKRELRKEIVKYYCNPYFKVKDKIQYLMCYLNVFRCIYNMHSFIKNYKN